MPTLSKPTSDQIHSTLYPRERTRRSELAYPTSRPSAFSATAARSSANRAKNRYADILPYDRTRVKIDGLDTDDGYLNANYITELDGQRVWIAASAPLPDTIPSFYTYLLSSPTQTIIQLTGLIESGVVKADEYLPSSTTPLVLPDCTQPGSVITVRRLGPSTFDSETEGYITKLSLEGRGLVKEVTHLFFAGWPDRGVPEGKDSILRLIKFIKLANSRNATTSSQLGDRTDPPMLAHCSAGVGRTGAFIAVASLLRLYAAGNGPDRFPMAEKDVLSPLPKIVKDDPVAKTIDHCRDQRTTMVQTAEQVDFVSEASELILKERLWA